VTAEKLLTRNFDRADSHTLRAYLETGGYTAWQKAQTLEPAAITEEVKQSNLRGLGGAGFPTGTKWSFVPKNHTGPVYLVINADEGEPGTFKDRYLLERDPHDAGYLGRGFDVVVHRGAGAYICGEETGLISSLEGKKGWPKLKPPFPAIKGAFGAPTIVNNVETIAHVPHIINRGAAWFASLGTKTQGGTRMYSVSGRVTRPGVYEASVAITLRRIIEDLGGGVTGNGRLKAVVPGGSSAAILRADEIDVTADVDGLRNAGTMAGSAGVIVMDETVSIPEALMVVARFYAHESCGQCTPCRESTGWIYKMVRRIVEGRGQKDDLDTILDVARRGTGTTICAFYDGAVGPYISYIEKFRAEFEALIPK